MYQADQIRGHMKILILHITIVVDISVLILGKHHFGGQNQILD